MDIQFLLEILACPKCRGPLTLLEKNANPAGFLCKTCGCVYPIENEIPVMLPERAVPAPDFSKTLAGDKCES